MDIRSEIELFTPGCEQEQRDKAQMLSWLDSTPDPFTRANTVGHFSASSWIVSPDRQQVLLIYHNIYRSWAWTGGHARRGKGPSGRGPAGSPGGKRA